MPLASAPRGPVEIPDVVRVRAPDAIAVWQNQAGGLTFRADGRYLKWNPAGTGESLAAERERLAWMAPLHPVPEVLDYVAAQDGELLVTRALPGEGAVHERWLAEPRTAVRAIGEGLRAMHEGLPVSTCPYDWGVESRMRGKDVPDLGTTPEIDLLVVCHGDACAPNTIIGADGRWVGHVDVAAVGSADRWADLAVASVSLDWNYGPGWEPEFFAAYGIAPDADHIRFYRALWNAT
ncbi:aminoglycoside 3'-phosphotransferase [Homoserinibacter sp. GY 40078]|nr:aminoglycoside 3'-phosphotransferase [Homoserinibacter sp. GY 40078]